MNLLSNKYMQSLFTYVKYGLMLLIVPIVLNYAALNQESTVLSKHGR